MNLVADDINATTTGLTSVMNFQAAAAFTLAAGGAVGIGAGAGVAITAGGLISITTPGSIQIGSGNVLPGADTEIEKVNFNENDISKAGTANITLSDVSTIRNDNAGSPLTYFVDGSASHIFQIAATTPFIMDVNGNRLTSVSTTNISTGNISVSSIGTNTISSQRITTSTINTTFISSQLISNSTINTNFISSGSGFINDVTVSSITGLSSYIMVSAKQRITQQLPYSTVSGFYALDKEKNPLPNPQTFGTKATTTWTLRTAPNNVTFQGIAYAPSLQRFCAVANSGTAAQRVMTSENGINWTARTAATANNWTDIVWAPELSLFVACANSGGTDRVMTSPDGITWTTRTTNNNAHQALTWSSELRLFVMVANSGTGNRVSTSPDGITWTTQTSAADNSWVTVTWSPELGIFLAMSGNGAQRAMISRNGVNWVAYTLPVTEYNDVCWSPELGVFCAVCTFTGTRSAVSPDGINWTVGTSIQPWVWFQVIWVAEMGLFVAVGFSSSFGRIATSSDGITWTNRTILGNQQWADCVYAPELGLIAMVSNDTVASTDKAATSSLPARVPTSYNIFDNLYNRIDESGIWYYSTIKPVRISDSTGSVGSSNQFLTSGTAGGAVTWTSVIGFTNIFTLGSRTPSANSYTFNCPTTGTNPIQTILGFNFLHVQPAYSGTTLDTVNYKFDVNVTSKYLIEMNLVVRTQTLNYDVNALLRINGSETTGGFNYGQGSAAAVNNPSYATFSFRGAYDLSSGDYFDFICKGVGGTFNGLLLNGSSVSITRIE
jgi:hypothetical protein